MMKKLNKRAFITIALTTILILNMYSIIFNGADNVSAQDNNDYGDVMQYEWPLSFASEAWDGYNAGPAPESADLLWQIDAPGARTGRYYPIAFGGLVYIYSGSTMYAYDGITGALEWQNTYPGSVSDPAKIDDTHMMAGAQMINPRNGALLWSAEPQTSPTTGAKYTFSTSSDFRGMGGYSSTEKLYFKALMAWDFSNPDEQATILWDQQAQIFGNYEFEAYGPDVNGRGVIIHRSDNQANGLDARTGEVIWTCYTSGGYQAYRGSYYDGAFYKGSVDGLVYAINATDGTLLWKFSDGAWYAGFGGGGSAAAYGMYYVIRYDGTLYAFNAKTGDVVWTYKAPGWMYYAGAPIVADGKVYVTMPDGGIDPFTGEETINEYVCVDAYTGKLLFKLANFTPGGSGMEPHMVAYGNLYMISESNKLRCYGEANSGWPMFRRDPQLSGVGLSGPQNLALKWSYETLGPILACPTIVNDKVYVGSQDEYLYCLDYSTGEEIWKFKTNTVVLATVAVIDGVVYTGADDGHVYALDADDGTEVWTTTVGPFAPGNLSARWTFGTSSPIVEGNRIYVGSVDSKLYCLNKNSGQILWDFETVPGEKRAFITSLKTSAAVVDGAVWIIGSPISSSEKYEMYKLDAITGAVLFQFRIPYTVQMPTIQTMFSSPLVMPELDMIFVPNQNDLWYAFNYTTGEVIWSFKQQYSSQIVGVPTYFNGALYFNDGFFVECVNATTGEDLWSEFEKREIYMSTTIAGYGLTGDEKDISNAKVYVGNNANFLSVLNATSGYKESFAFTESFMGSSVTLYKGRAYIGNRDHRVYCYEEASYTPPLFMKIETIASATQIDTEDTITVTGSVFPNIPGGVPLTVTFTKPNGANLDVPATLDSEGQFEVSYKAYDVGSWNIVAWTPLDQFSSIDNSYSNAIQFDVIDVIGTPEPSEEPTGLNTTEQSIIVAVVVIAIIIAAVSIYMLRKKK